MRVEVTEMPETHRRTIEDVRNGMECSRDFACCRPGSQRPCPTRLVAGSKLLECLEEEKTPCRFAVDFGVGRFCECPLQAFLLENPLYCASGHD